MSFLQIETLAGEPIQSAWRRLTLFSQVVQLRLPGLHGGLIWNRPHSLLVQAADGSESVVRIPDPTRQAQLTFLGIAAGAALLFGIYSALSGRRLRRETHE